MSYNDYKKYNQYLTCCKPTPGPDGPQGPQGPQGVPGKNGAKYLSFNTQALPVDFSNNIVEDGSLCLFVETDLAYTPSGGNSVMIVDHINSVNRFYAIVESYNPLTGYICLKDINNIEGDFSSTSNILININGHPPQWDEGTNDSLFYNKGNVGIGTNGSPAYTLDVSGNINYTGTLTGNNAFLTNATITNATVTNASVTTLDASNANIDNATITNATVTNASVTTLDASNANIDNATITSATITSASVTTLDASNANIDNATITSASISDLTITNGLDMSCNPIIDVSYVQWCNGSYIGPLTSTSFDISTNQIFKINTDALIVDTNKNTTLKGDVIVIDISKNIGFNTNLGFINTEGTGNDELSLYLRNTKHLVKSNGNSTLGSLSATKAFIESENFAE